MHLEPSPTKIKVQTTPGGPSWTLEATCICVTLILITLEQNRKKSISA